MSPEQRLQVLKKAREAKAAKAAAKTEGAVEKITSNAPKTEEPKPKPKRAPKAKKEPVKTLDLTEDKHQVPDAELDIILEPSEQEKKEIKQINNRGNPKPKPILKEPEEEEEEEQVQIIEEYIKKPKKKKKVIRRIIEEESSEDDQEIVYQKAPKRASKPKAAKPRAAPPPRIVPEPPKNPFFCY
jgi:hypothetical protein